MAAGINHAKKIVIDEAEQLAKDLQNGHAGDPHTQGRAIALIVKMITPLYTAEFVTAEDCHRQHDVLNAGKMVKVKLGPVEFEGAVTPTIMLTLTILGSISGVLFIVGKALFWW